MTLYIIFKKKKIGNGFQVARFLSSDLFIFSLWVLLKSLFVNDAKTNIKLFKKDAQLHIRVYK